MRLYFLLGLALALVACSSPPRSRGGEVTLEFNGNNAERMTDPLFEFVMERKAQGSPDTSFAEVVKGKGTATGTADRFRLVDTNVPTGRWTYQARARMNVPVTPLVSGPSNQVTAGVGPNAPSNLLLTFDATVINFRFLGTLVYYETESGTKIRWG